MNDVTPEDIEKARGFMEWQRQEYETLRRMPYKDYLQTDHWKRIRRKKLDQAEPQCEKCGGTRDLQVHHIRYDRRGAEDLEMSDLIVLCRPCHQKEHS